MGILQNELPLIVKDRQRITAYPHANLSVDLSIISDGTAVSIRLSREQLIYTRDQLTTLLDAMQSEIGGTS